MNTLFVEDYGEKNIIENYVNDDEDKIKEINDEILTNKRLLEYSNNKMLITGKKILIWKYISYITILLLIFIAYIVTQFIKLFSVNLNLTGGK